MRRREFIALLGSAMLTPPVAHAGAVHGLTPTAKRLVGAWRFVSAVNLRDDGSNSDRWGPNARGMLMFDRSGQFTQVIASAESRMFGAKSFFATGEFSVEEDAQILVSRIETSSIAKLAGVIQRREIKSLTDDELRYINPVSATGTKVEAVWRRIRSPEGAG
jgi:hypothetical protein